jgi:hypothetical protein
VKVSKSRKVTECFRCDGTGKICDVCGESPLACECDECDGGCVASDCEDCGGTGK